MKIKSENKNEDKYLDEAAATLTIASHKRFGQFKHVASAQNLSLRRIPVKSGKNGANTGKAVVTPAEIAQTLNTTGTSQTSVRHGPSINLIRKRT